MPWVRKKLGDEIFLGCQCLNSSKQPAAPDAAPVMNIYNENGTLIVSKSIPPLERYTAIGLFGYMQPLNSLFAVGRYAVYYKYNVSGTQGWPNADTFEITAGGNTGGQVINMTYLDRADVDWIIGSVDMGGTTLNRNPHL